MSSLDVDEWDYECTPIQPINSSPRTRIMKANLNKLKINPALIKKNTDLIEFLKLQNNNKDKEIEKLRNEINMYIQTKQKWVYARN